MEALNTQSTTTADAQQAATAQGCFGNLFSTGVDLNELSTNIFALDPDSAGLMCMRQVIDMADEEVTQFAGMVLTAFITACVITMLLVSLIGVPLAMVTGLAAGVGFGKVAHDLLSDVTPLEYEEIEPRLLLCLTDKTNPSWKDILGLSHVEYYELTLEYVEAAAKSRKLEISNNTNIPDSTKEKLNEIIATTKGRLAAQLGFIEAS